MLKVELGFGEVEGVRHQLFPEHFELALQRGVEDGSGFPNWFGGQAELAGRHRHGDVFMESATVDIHAERDVIVAFCLLPVVPELEAAVAGTEVGKDGVNTRAALHSFIDVVFEERRRWHTTREPVAREIVHDSVCDSERQHLGVQRIDVNVGANDIRNLRVVAEPDNQIRRHRLIFDELFVPRGSA